MAEKKLAKRNSVSTAPSVKGTAVQTRDNALPKGMTDSQALAAVVTRSGMTAKTIKSYSSCGDALELADVMGEMRKAGEEVVAGDMHRVEKMLVNQMLALDSIFNLMAQRASKVEQTKTIEIYIRMAMKAQAQARTTAEALALLKNPQPYIRQANIANGPQQVNNGMRQENSAKYAQAHTGAGNLQSAPNKLLEAEHGQRLDIGATKAAGRADQAVGAVAKVYRTQDTNG